MNFSSLCNGRCVNSYYKHKEGTKNESTQQTLYGKVFAKSSNLPLFVDQQESSVAIFLKTKIFIL